MLGVEVIDRTVVVRGRAPSHHVKQLALVGVLDVLGSHDSMQVELNVEVVAREANSEAEIL